MPPQLGVGGCTPSPRNDSDDSTMMSSASWKLDTTIDGEKNDDRQSNARLGLTLALSVTRHHSIKLYGSKAVATRIGGDYDVYGLALQYRWGGGL